jgi:hypothetical protein
VEGPNPAPGEQLVSASNLLTIHISRAWSAVGEHALAFPPRGNVRWFAFNYLVSAVLQLWLRISVGQEGERRSLWDRMTDPFTYRLWLLVGFAFIMFIIPNWLHGDAEWTPLVLLLVPLYIPVASLLVELKHRKGMG